MKDGLMAFLTFFNLSLNLAIMSSWSEPQSVPCLVFANCIELLHLCCKEYNQSDFSVDHLVMCMCSLLLCCWKRVFAMTSLQMQKQQFKTSRNLKKIKETLYH